jgi:hypothetical protein
MLCPQTKNIVSPYLLPLLLLNLLRFRLLNLFLSLNMNMVRPSYSRCFLYSRKSVIRLNVGLRMIRQDFSVFCRIAYRWIKKHCRFVSYMSPIVKMFNSKFLHVDMGIYYQSLILNVFLYTYINFIGVSYYCLRINLQISTSCINQNAALYNCKSGRF